MEGSYGEVAGESFMTKFRTCDCNSLFCEHNPYPFTQLKAFEVILHYYFSKYRWFRKSSGGKWQHFKLEKDYFTWHKVNYWVVSESEVEREEWT